MTDKFFDDLIQEFFVRRKEINVAELMSLFPDFDGVVKEFTLDKIKILLPDVFEQY